MEASSIINVATHEFTIPAKTLVTLDDLEKFKSSNAFKEIISFIAALQKSVEKKSNADVVQKEVISIRIIIY